jgi:hypothetical protein
MSHKSKKRKARKAPEFLYPAPAYLSSGSGPPPDFAEFERQAARREARHEELRYRIAPDCKVHIQFNGIATREAIRKLINYLEMAIGDFPKNDDDLSTQE